MPHVEIYEAKTSFWSSLCGNCFFGGRPEKKRAGRAVFGAGGFAQVENDMANASSSQAVGHF